jgi:type I restriction enzyme S subunit
MGQDVCLIRSSKENQRLLNYFFHSPSMKLQLAFLLVGSTFDRINIAEIKGLIVVIPPRDEQDEITSYLDEALKNIERLIVDANREISLLREYRTRLIADVVTGKLDVREAAESLPAEAEELEILDAADALTDEETDAADNLDDISEENEA